MYFYFPKSELKNCPKGFNLLPIVRSEEDPTKFKTDLSLTPFHDYEKSIIQISNKEYVDTRKCVELTSYLLLRCGEDWLIIESSILDKKTLRVGLLEEFVNRGEEQRVYSYNFNSIRTGMSAGEKAVVVLGYIVTDDRVIFVNRFDFPDVPAFLNKNAHFTKITGEELFSEDFLNRECLDKHSKFIISCIKDVLPSM